MEKLDLKKALEKKIPEILRNSWYKLKGDFTEKYHSIKEKYKENGIDSLNYCLSYVIEDHLNNEFNYYYNFLDLDETNDFLKKELEEFGIDYKISIYLEKNSSYYCCECHTNGYDNKVTCNIQVTSYNKKILKEYQAIFKNCFSLFENEIKKNDIERVRKDKIHELKKSYENLVNLYFDEELTEEYLSIFIPLFKSVEMYIEEDLKKKIKNFLSKNNII